MVARRGARIRSSSSPAARLPPDELKAFANRGLVEYDLRGWTGPDLINPGRTSVLAPT
jgi:hypothetical protein